jgi:hypothetical protein
MIKFPRIAVDLDGCTNVYTITAVVMRQMRMDNVASTDMDDFCTCMMSSPPSLVVETCKKWVTIITKKT